jgi:hypothetical protein
MTKLTVEQVKTVKFLDEQKKQNVESIIKSTNLSRRTVYRILNGERDYMLEHTDTKLNHESQPLPAKENKTVLYGFGSITPDGVIIHTNLGSVNMKELDLTASMLELYKELNRYFNK